MSVSEASDEFGALVDGARGDVRTRWPPCTERTGPHSIASRTD